MIGFLLSLSKNLLISVRFLLFLSLSCIFIVVRFRFLNLKFLEGKLFLINIPLFRQHLFLVIECDCYFRLFRILITELNRLDSEPFLKGNFIHF